MQQKQLTDKSQHSTTEAKGSLRETVQPKLSWMGMSHTAKLPNRTTTPIVSKPQAKPSAVAAITSSQYGPSIPPSIKGQVHLLYCVTLQ